MKKRITYKVISSYKQDSKTTRKKAVTLAVQRCINRKQSV